jgi:Zn-dependent M28 family amino/carboxypeptidase
MRRSRVAILATAVLTLTTASAAQAKDHGHGHGHHGHHGHGHGVSSSQLERAVSVKRIVRHQRALQTIADMNGGTRHTKTPGYTASVAYVSERMRRAGLDVSIKQFNMPEWEETAPPVFEQLSPDAKTYTPGTAADDDSAAVDYITFGYSPTAAIPSAPVVPTSNIVIPAPAANSNTSGCDPADFPAATSGAISLIQRGTCPFVQKIANAQAAGAVGVILFNEGDSAGRMNAGFRSGPTDLAIPAVFSSFAVGKELYDAFQAGDNPTVRLETSGTVADHFYPQVVAETKRGDPRHVVVSGAHLDSVPAGPGVNDDGSGTSWQLALAEQIQKLHAKPKHKIRFLWFGGEEDGLVGSQYYASHLTEAEVAKIDVMIDTDMIASPNYARFVYDGNGDELGPAGPEGSGTVEDVFKRYFGRRGQATLPVAFDGRSDYVGFINLGIPAGGIFAGAEVPKTEEQVAVFGGVAGEQYDPCYHEACDNIGTVTGQPPAETMNVYEADPTPENLGIAQQQADSLNGNALKSLREMAPAVTNALWYFAQTKNALPPREAAARQRAQKRAYAFKQLGHTRTDLR